MKKIVIQLFRFGVVGVIATIVDFGVLMLLKESLHMDVLLASAISFFASVTANYILSMLFVFESNTSNKIKEFLVFVGLSIGGLLINQLVMWYGTHVLTAYYLWVKVFALLVVPIYNFVTRKLLLEKNVS